MCQVHGKMIDDNASRHTVAELQRWKTQHEEWVFRRVASADSVVKHGLTSISLRNVGPFREKTTVALGRHTVLLGPNGAGKSSLGEAIAAFAGSQNFDAFSERWSLFGPRSPDMAISASISVDGARRTVRLSEEKTGLRPPLVRRQTRLHIEVDGGVTIHWPRSLFNVVLLEKQDRKPTVSDPFRRDLRFIGGQLGLGEDHIWDGLREELFAGAPFGSRIRRVGEYMAEVQTAEHDFFLPTSNLSGSERTLVLLDVLLRLLQADPRPTPWVLIIDSGMFHGLDGERKRHVVQTLRQLDTLSLQTIVCLHSEEQAIELIADDEAHWIGSSAHGALTVHTFQ